MGIIINTTEWEYQRFERYYCDKCAKRNTDKCRESKYRLSDGTVACRRYRCAAIEGR